MDIISSKALELIPYLKYPNFNEILSQVTNEIDIANSEFLIRMELKRLCSPSVRIIDFRADGDTELFEYNGITHFLQKDDIEDFKRLLDLYSGVYSNGLYEELMRNHSERKKLKREDQTSLINEFNVPSRFEVEKIKFTHYAHRRDERMFYCSPIIITLPSGRRLDAKTSDLSCSGVKILLPFEIPFKKGEVIKVTFTGLIELHKKAAAFLKDIPYEILGTESKDTRNYAKTRCLGDNADFEKFILDFQAQNRYRYRIDINYLAYIINIQAIALHYLPKIGAIPLFFGKDDNLDLMYALKSEYNHPMLDYWRDERSDDKIRTLFSKERLEQLLSKKEPLAYTYIYSFKHTSHGKTYFFSATMDELLKSNLLTTFLKMAKGRNSFRVFKFTLAPLTLDELTIKQICSNQESVITEDILTTLRDIGYFGILERIDKEYDKGIYAQYTSEINPNELQIFMHQTDNIAPVKLEYLQYITPRTEPRFIFKTPITINADTLDDCVIGWTRDISTKGLQVELSEPIKCYNGNIVYVSLPKFAEMRKNVSFANISYDVIYVNPAHTILHLKIHNLHLNNPISNFLNDFIKANIKVLEQAPTVPHMSTLSKILRTLTVSNIFTCPIIFMKGFTNRLAYQCVTNNNVSINDLLHIYKSQANHANLYPIFSEGVLKNYILELLPKLKVRKLSENINVFIKKYFDEEGNIKYLPKTEESFTNLEEIVSFINQGFTNGYFGAFAIRLTGSSKPDIDELRDELSYIKKCSPHKYTILENSIWSILGVGELTDITESILLKYHQPIKPSSSITDKNMSTE